MKRFFLLFFAFFIINATFSKFNIPETPFSEYVFPAKDCKLIQHRQSRIFVPANAFYLEGKLYDGEVLLKYREFTDQLDIVLNNIPMTYRENARLPDGQDKQHVLESGGMFELYAYGKGKQLSFAPHKRIQVLLASKFDVNGGETFILNRSKNTWEKKTTFAGLPESNQIISDNKQDLWGDSWRDAESAQIMDDSGKLWRVSIAGVQTYEELRDQSFKTIQVDKMAFYNCDKILNETTVPIVADFKLEGYKEKLNSAIYVVYKNKNAVLTYYPGQFAADFKLLPNEDFTIFSFSQDGKIAVLEDSFTAGFDAKSNANKKVVFPMKVFSKLPATKDELAKITGL